MDFLGKVFIGLVVLGIVGAVGLTAFWVQKEERIEAEAYAQWLQFCLTTGVGGGVALAIQRLNREHEKRQQREESDRIEQQKTLDREREERQRNRTTLRDMYASALAAYNQAKSVRRLVNAQLTSTGDQISRDTYDEQLRALNEAQLKLEALSRIAKGETRLFGSRPEIAASLRTIEDYLNDIVDEYEGELRKFAGPTGLRPLKDLERLEDFASRSSKSKNFDGKFSDPLKAVLKALAAMINDDGQDAAAAPAAPTGRGQSA